MDDERLACAPRDRDLSREGPPLILGIGAVPVEVEPGLPDGDDTRARAELLDPLRRLLVEPACPVRMAPDGRKDFIVNPSRAHHIGVRVLAQTDVEDAPNGRLAGGRQQLRLILLAEAEVRVRVDHGPSL